MRTTLMLLALSALCCANSALGTWKMDDTRSTFTGSPRPRSLTVRIEPHPKGEVFTLDRIEADGRATSSSTVLYFDGSPRDFQDFDCSGTQTSRRVDSQTVEILRKCGSGEWIRYIRRSPAQPKEMIFDVTEGRPDGQRFERRLVLTKQSASQ